MSSNVSPPCFLVTYRLLLTEKDLIKIIRHCINIIEGIFSLFIEDTIIFRK